MKHDIALFTVLFLFNSAFAVEQQPSWLLHHKPNEATGCAVIKKGNVMVAQRVALAKARAEYLTMQQAEISSSILMAESSNGQDFTQTISVKTKGKAGIELLPTKQAKTTNEGLEQWCVLVSGTFATSR